jgi:DNA-binding FadR family transcriptional regulator
MRYDGTASPVSSGSAAGRVSISPFEQGAQILTRIPPSQASRAVRVPKAAELIAASLRQRIAMGELMEGDALPPEADLIVEFGVSRASLREALRILENEGLIEVRRGAHGGARIRLPREDTAAHSMGLLLQIRGATLKDMFDARVIIEPPLIHQLAQIRTEDDLVAIREHIELERAALDDVRAFAAAAAEFHRLMIGRSGNSVLILVAGMLDELYLKHLNQFIASARPDQAQLNRETLLNHQRLADLIESRDGPAAETLWRYHMQGARKIILGQLGEGSKLALY